MAKKGYMCVGVESVCTDLGWEEEACDFKAQPQFLNFG